MLDLCMILYICIMETKKKKFRRNKIFKETFFGCYDFVKKEDVILSYLKEGKSINHKECVELLNINNLSAYIHKLKKRGYNIVSKTVKFKKRYYLI